MWRIFSSKHEHFPEAPKDDPPDPNEGRTLPESLQHARRSLVVVCGLCLAWSTAQFNLRELTVDAAGVSVDLSNGSIPLLLAMVLLYTTYRWGFEFAIMSRNLRRWPLARLDFRVVSLLARFSLLAIAAAALDRSFRSVLAVSGLLFLLALSALVLTTVLMIPAMFIRMWIRQRAGRVSAANASFEALVWAELIAVGLTVLVTIGIVVASYSYPPLRDAVWGQQSPRIWELSAFATALVVVFMSNWLMTPLYRRLFAEPLHYWTERDDKGGLLVKFRDVEKEPLL
jgi:hypothetical protein